MLVKAFWIFWVGGRSHSRFLKINGINRTVTSSTQIQIFKGCDTLQGMTCLMHDGGEGILGSECSVFSFKCSGVLQGYRATGGLADGDFAVGHCILLANPHTRMELTFIRPNPAKSDHRIFKGSDAGPAISVRPQATRAINHGWTQMNTDGDKNLRPEI